MKKSAFVILFILLSTFNSYAQEHPKYFEGFHYGMSKDDQKALVEKKISEGIFTSSGFGSKRHVTLSGFEFESKFMSRKFQIMCIFKHVKKKLMVIQITPSSEGAKWGGGMNRKKATALKREFQDYVTSLGYEMDIELEQTSGGYYRLYMPIGQIVLDDI